MKTTTTDKLNRICISKHASILAALKQMDALDVKLLVVTENDRFQSLLSIGDIQRAIIRNIPLESEIHQILRKQIRVAHHDEEFEVIRQRMLAYRTECMPVLDQEQNLVDIYFWDDIFLHQKRNEAVLTAPVVIMAGGRGTRLKPLTNVIPKPLIPIGEKTIIEIILEKFTRLGVTDFYVSVNYKAEMLKHYFETLDSKIYHLHYFQEDQPLGTAGSLYLLKDHLHTTFFVSNCDILVEQDFREVYDYHVQNANDLTIIASIKTYSIPYGTVETGENGILCALTEKPELHYKINTGVYLLEPHVLHEMPENQFFLMTDLIAGIQARQGKIGVFPISEKSWIDIGEWQNYINLLNTL